MQSTIPFPKTTIYTSGGVTAKRTGNLVTIEISATKDFTSAGWKTLCTLPVEFRAADYAIRFACFDNDVGSFSASNVIPTVITLSGDVNIYAFSDNLSIHVCGNAAYFMN